MPAYIVSRVNIEDRDAMNSYFEAAPETVLAYGGRYLARTGDLVPLEGEERVDRMVVLEFPDEASARAWYDSAAYRPLRAQRWAAAEAKIILIPEGS
jgi:uncharacterized protein (DUF1330 family)